MLPDSIALEVVTPERRVVRAVATEVQVPALDGFLGILPGHAPLLSELGEGELSYRAEGQTYYAAVFGGYVEVLAGRVILLAEVSERAEEIDSARAAKAKAAAEKILSTPGTPDEAAAAARRALARADLRLKVAAHATTGASARELAHSA
ncbi:MAG TPA: ATP synthase F1 subunit epsilon [Candidatus Acidoferrales bacterium]|jgi:F-type H+-transporting ATPase subunit epsilon|nr:ATP synthase F1 subunit epsilon [Candidatus Acidoferrales bacterium]